MISAAVTGFILSRRGSTGPNLVQYNPALDPFILLFMIAAIITTVFSLNPEVSLYGQYERQIGLITILLIGLLYFCSRVVLRDESQLRKIILAMESAAALISVYAILQKFGMDPFEIQPPGIKRPVTTLGNAVFAGGFLALTLPLAILNSSLKKNIILRVLYPVLILSGITVTGTRSAYLAVFCGLVGMIIFFPLMKDPGNRSKIFKKPLITISVVILVFVLLAYIFPENQFVRRFMSIFSEDDNTRLYLWRDSFNIFYKYPLFGSGTGMFPNALEEYYSIRLKKDEILRIFDNAHNNYLHILCTMGVTGFIAYMLMLAAGVGISIKGLFSKKNDRDKKLLFLSFFTVLISYSVYGLTNFDDISILLYLFIIFAMLSALRFKSNSENSAQGKTNKMAGYIFGSLAVMFSLFCIYNSYKIVIADRYYLEGVKAFEVNDIRGGVSGMNEAVYMNPACGYYRYGLASNVYRWAVLHSGSNIKMKINLLNQAEQEMLRARKNFKSEKECDAVLAMINYELGNSIKADSIKNEVFRKDPISINFRLRLVEYYLKNENTDAAKENLDEIGKTGYEPVDVLNARGYYYFKINDPIKAEENFKRVLALDPGNVFAKETLGKLQK